MKLSEAIRLGAMLKPQAREDLIQETFDASTGKLVVATCALGAALDAVGLIPENGWRDCCYNVLVTELWPILRSTAEEPCIPLWNKITRLNDDEGWSREAIADYVEKLENVQELRQKALAEAFEPTPVTPVTCSPS